MKIFCHLIAAVLVLGSIFAQTPTAHPAFEVVSIKPAEGFTENQPASGGIRIDGAQVHLVRYSLKRLIPAAYGIKTYQVMGPDWLDSLRFNIDAKLPAGSSRAQVPEMLQSLLVDRFQMKFHNGSKELPVYSLVLAAGGTKLKDVSDPDGAANDKPNPNGAIEATGFGGRQGLGANYGKGSSYTLASDKFDGKKLTISRLADILSSCLDRPVVDKTGLTGQYDITIPLSEEDYRGMLIRSGVNAGVALDPRILRYLDSADNASLNEGLRAVGLKLEPRKAPVPVMVIDSIVKSPTEN